MSAVLLSSKDFYAFYFVKYLENPHGKNFDSAGQNGVLMVTRNFLRFGLNEMTPSKIKDLNFCWSNVDPNEESLKSNVNFKELI